MTDEYIPPITIEPDGQWVVEFADDMIPTTPEQLLAAVNKICERTGRVPVTMAELKEFVDRVGVHRDFDA